MAITVMVSGGFDCLHLGHLKMMQAAKNLADSVIVVVNSDDWLMRKKGYVFMPAEERCSIIASMSIIGHMGWVYLMNSTDCFSQSYDGQVCKFTHNRIMRDDDGTVKDAIAALRPDIFANGGDRGKDNVPEKTLCDALNIRMAWGVGGENKTQSSSQLVQNLHDEIQRLRKIIALSEAKDGIRDGA